MSPATHHKIIHYASACIEHYEKPLSDFELAACVLLQIGDFELLAELGYPRDTEISQENLDPILNDLAHKIGNVLRTAFNIGTANPVPAVKKRGRPKGSKNKPKAMTKPH